MSHETPSLPFLYVNMAMTADGKIATANREISSFGSAADKRHLLELRSSADAVMAGARTVDLNPVNLGPGGPAWRKKRVRSGLREYNVRVIVSRTGSINLQAEIFRHRFSPIVVLTTQAAGRARLEALEKCAEAWVCGEREIDFRKALERLKEDHGVNRLLCEGGGELNDALFRAGLVHELHLTICPLVFGGRNAPTIADGKGREFLREASLLELRQVRRVGAELFTVYRVCL
jgi:riboflavin-specific deaminase-like protein